MAEELTIKQEYRSTDPETKEVISTVRMASRDADRFELPLTDTQRDEILVALAIKAGIVRKPLTDEEIAERESG